MCKMSVLKLELVLILNLWLVSGDVFNNEVSEHSLELTQSLNLARQELIQETCRRFPPRYGIDELPKSLLEHILIDEDRKLLYCYVPKVSFQGKPDGRTEKSKLLLANDYKLRVTNIKKKTTNLRNLASFS